MSSDERKRRESRSLVYSENASGSWDLATILADWGEFPSVSWPNGQVVRTLWSLGIRRNCASAVVWAVALDIQFVELVDQIVQLVAGFCGGLTFGNADAVPHRFATRCQ